MEDQLLVEEVEKLRKKAERQRERGSRRSNKKGFFEEREWDIERVALG